MTCKIALVGEAYGEAEEQWHKPFVGSAGQELDRMLADAGLLREECFLTNVFNIRPDRNDIKSLCGDRSEGIPGVPSILPGYYIKREYAGEIARLRSELESVRPNVVVLLGNVACWAVLGTQAISKIRGTATIATGFGGFKCLPTYHPSAVNRQWELRHVTVLDLAKAKRESEFPELRRPARTVFDPETLEDIDWYVEQYLVNAKEMAFDIETAAEQITCIGFAATIDRALCIPIVDQRNASGSYWPDLSTEVAVWSSIQRILNLPCRKMGQNTLYDIQYLWQRYGITVHNYTDDTMLLHHALQPESPKGLDFLGSVYTNEVAWKTHRPKGEHTIKRED